MVVIMYLHDMTITLSMHLMSCRMHLSVGEVIGAMEYQHMVT